MTSWFASATRVMYGVLIDCFWTNFLHPQKAECATAETTKEKPTDSADSSPATLGSPPELCDIPPEQHLGGEQDDNAENDLEDN